jgi:uncharacterized protein
MFRLTIAACLRAVALTVALTALGPSTQAQQSTAALSPAVVQLAREVVVASGATRAFDGVVPSILQQTLGVFVQQNPDLQKDLTETVKSLAPEFEKRVTEIVEIVARVYATRLTESELKEILAFYRSASGKKMVSVLPNILEESFIKAQEWGSRLSEEFVIRMRADMKKKGHAI